MTTNNTVSPMKFCYNTILPVLNNPKDLEPSSKMDPDFWDCFGRNIFDDNFRMCLFSIKKKKKTSCASR